MRIERLTGVCADRLGDRVVAEDKDRGFTDEQRMSLKPVLCNLVRRIRESDGKPERASMVKHLVRWGYTSLHRHLATQQQNCLVCALAPTEVLRRMLLQARKELEKSRCKELLSEDVIKEITWRHILVADEGGSKMIQVEAHQCSRGVLRRHYRIAARNILTETAGTEQRLEDVMERLATCDSGQAMLEVFPFLRQILGPTETMDATVLLEAALGILQHAVTAAANENESAVRRKRDADGQSDEQGGTVERWRNTTAAVDAMMKAGRMSLGLNTTNAGPSGTAKSCHLRELAYVYDNGVKCLTIDSPNYPVGQLPTGVVVRTVKATEQKVHVPFRGDGEPNLRTT
ncbi:MAG: hypothetical protein VYC81_00405, partial [Actinomycetota bacterium]|nr:hypothetical protein [Actinomycetota bacterium]